MLQHQWRRASNSCRRYTFPLKSLADNPFLFSFLFRLHLFRFNLFLFLAWLIAIRSVFLLPKLKSILISKFDVCGNIGFAGRENSEKGGNGDVCYSAHHHVLRHVGPPNTQDDIVLICKLGFSSDLTTMYLLLIPIQILRAHTRSFAVPSRRIWDF